MCSRRGKDPETGLPIGVWGAPEGKSSARSAASCRSGYRRGVIGVRRRAMDREEGEVKYI